MSFFSRFSAILFVVLLSFLSIGKNAYEAVHPETVLHSNTDVSSTSEAALEKISDVLGIRPQHKFVLNQLSNTTVTGPNIPLKALLNGLFALEERSQQYPSGFVAQVIKSSPSLSVRAIIFPFHYFW